MGLRKAIKHLSQNRHYFWQDCKLLSPIYKPEEFQFEPAYSPLVFLVLRDTLLILFSGNSNEINKLIICTCIKSQYKQEIATFIGHFYLQTAADIQSSPLNVFKFVLYNCNVT